MRDPATTPDRDPVQEVREHLEQALAALEFLLATLPPAVRTESSDPGPGKPGRR